MGAIHIGFVVYLLLGYCVRYFFEFVFVVGNEDELVRQLTHTVPALHMVDRVAQITGGNPVPMKMLVTYAIVGSFCWLHGVSCGLYRKTHFVKWHVGLNLIGLQSYGC